MCTIVCVACVLCKGDDNAGVGAGGGVFAERSLYVGHAVQVLCPLPTTC